MTRSEPLSLLRPGSRCTWTELFHFVGVAWRRTLLEGPAADQEPPQAALRSGDHRSSGQTQPTHPQRVDRETQSPSSCGQTGRSVAAKLCVFRAATATCILILMIPLKIRSRTARTAGAARCPPLLVVNTDKQRLWWICFHSFFVSQFVSSGGLQLLLDIFNSAILEPKDQESWTVVRLLGSLQTRPINRIACLFQSDKVWLLSCPVPLVPSCPAVAA